MRQTKVRSSPRSLARTNFPLGSEAIICGVRAIMVADREIAGRSLDRAAVARRALIALRHRPPRRARLSPRPAAPRYCRPRNSRRTRSGRTGCTLQWAGPAPSELTVLILASSPVALIDPIGRDAAGLAAVEIIDLVRRVKEFVLRVEGEPGRAWALECLDRRQRARARVRRARARCPRHGPSRPPCSCRHRRRGRPRPAALRLRAAGRAARRAAPRFAATRPLRRVIARDRPDRAVRRVERGKPFAHDPCRARFAGAQALEARGLSRA